MKYLSNNRKSAFSLVEVLVVSALITLVFGGLFGAFKYSSMVINNSKAKQSALSVANDRMEYFRSLPYDDVGTISGIPSGTIPQNSTTTLNGIVFSERVLVEYVDDEADGQDTATTSDSNGIPSDYKRVKVEYTWSMNNSTSSVFLVSNIVPRSVESTAGGGTVRINVIDADSSLLPGASVRLVNNTTTSTIDVSKFSDASGIALFSGAPAASDYEVTVTGPISGDVFSTDQTYEATTTNPIPVVASFSVLEADVSTLTFQIGELSDINIETLSVRDDGSVVEEFSDLLGVASSSNASSTGTELALDESLGVYETSGYVYLDTITPGSLYDWHSIRVVYTNPINTDSKVRLYTGVAPGPYTLIPDVDLPGNSTGFTQEVIDISVLDDFVYPSIVVGVELTTTDTGVTPVVDEVGVFYQETRTARPSVAMDIVGTKIIGQELDLTPIYKYDSSFTTDGAGKETLTDIEFDTYIITPQGAYDIASACSEHPVNHQAGVDTDVELLLVADAAHTLRIVVEDNYGDFIPGATVNLTRSGYDVTQDTNTCGQAFFTGGLTDDTDYVLTVTDTGYVDNITNPFTVSDDTVVKITMN